MKMAIIGGHVHETPAPATDRTLDSWALVQRAQAGDREAFAEIYRQNYALVYNFVNKRTGYQGLAEDITQDVFVRALNKIGTFTRPDREFSAWLLTVARNLIADRCKGARFRLEVVTGDVAVLDDVSRFDTERVAEQNLTAIDVWTSLLMLTPDQREAVTLFHLNGWTIAAVARHMGRHEGAVKALLTRGRSGMVRALRELEVVA